MATFNNKQEATEANKKIFSAAANLHDPHLGRAIANAPNNEAMMDIINGYAMDSINYNGNSLLNDVFTMIVKQQLKADRVGRIRGDISTMMGSTELDAGGGINLTAFPLNMAGNAALRDMNTPGSVSENAGGTNAENMPQISINGQTPDGVQLSRVSTVGAGRSQISQPYTWVKMSAATPTKAAEGFNGFGTAVANSRDLIYYNQGNQLFTPAFLPRNNITLAATNVKDAFYELMQHLQTMLGLTDQYNAGSTYGTNPSTGFENLASYNTPAGQYIPASGCYSYNMQNNGNDEDLIILMNPKVSAAFMSMLQVPGITESNGVFSKIETDAGRITSMMGVPVYITGIDYTPTVLPDTPNTAPTPNPSGGFVQPDNQILIISREYFEIVRVVEESVDSPRFTAGPGSIRAGWYQNAPLCRPWKTGAVFTCEGFTTQGVLNVAIQSTTTSSASK